MLYAVSASTTLLVSFERSSILHGLVLTATNRYACCELLSVLHFSVGWQISDSTKAKAAGRGFMVTRETSKPGPSRGAYRVCTYSKQLLHPILLQEAKDDDMDLDEEPMRIVRNYHRHDARYSACPCAHC